MRRSTLEAAERTTARRAELLRQRAGIAFETVFSTPEKVDFLRRARSSGYFVRVCFIGTEDPRINAARVAGRVMQGGHTVPIEKIISRHGKSMAKLSAAIRLADRVYIYDNSVDGIDARLCARTEDGKLRKIYGPLPPWVADAVQGLERHPAFVDLVTAARLTPAAPRRTPARTRRTARPADSRRARAGARAGAGRR